MKTYEPLLKSGSCCSLDRVVDRILWAELVEPFSILFFDAYPYLGTYKNESRLNITYHFRSIDSGIVEYTL